MIRLLMLCVITCGALAGPFVNNPRKVAQEHAEIAFASAGVLAKGVVGNVNEVQDVVVRMKKMLDELQRALYAPRSPSSRLQRIASYLHQFQHAVPQLEQFLSHEAILQLVQSESIRDEQFKAISDAGSIKRIRDFYGIYDALLKEMDGVVIHAILHHARQLLYETAGLLDSIAHIRDYAGTLSDEVLALEATRRIGELSAAVRVVARTINELMQGGALNIVHEREPFAKMLLEQGKQLDDAVRMMREAAFGMHAATQKMQTALHRLTRRKNKLIRSATMMHKRLTHTLFKAQKGAGGEDITALAMAELRVMVVGLHAPIQRIVLETTELLSQMIFGMQAGIVGINAFKTTIGFDVVNPVVRTDIDAMPQVLRELSRATTQLRTVMH